jgi:hypothetical protein
METPIDSANSHRDNLTHASRLITMAGGSPLYLPPDADMSITNYKAKIGLCRTAHKQVSPLKFTYENAKGERKVVFIFADEVEQQAYDYFKSIAGLTDFQKQEAKRWHAKFNGYRIDAIPDVPEDSEDTSSHSVSQQQFGFKIDFLQNLYNAYSQCGKYITTDPKISLTALDALIQDMISKNSSVDQYFMPWELKMQERDNLMYAPETGMVDTGLRIKAYCASIWLRKSEFFKKLNSIKLKNIKRKGTHIN